MRTVYGNRQTKKTPYNCRGWGVAAESWYNTPVLACLLAILELTIPEMLSGKYDYVPATLSGTVQDVLEDETDPTYVFFVIRQGDQSILAPMDQAKAEYHRFRDLIGARVRLTGQCDSTLQLKMRRQMGRRFDVRRPDGLVVIAPPPDIFGAPDISALAAMRPEEMSSLPRHRTLGRVLATWGGDKVLVQTPSNLLVRLDLADSEPPRFGASIEAVGFPETDLYHVNLSRARWRPADERKAPREQVTDRRLRSLLVKDGVPAFEKELYGTTVRVRGRVRDLPRDGVMTIEDEGFALHVDVSAIAGGLPTGLELGCTLEVTGSCIMDVDNWRPHAPFPRIRGIVLVTRTPDDLRVLARPPWWTIEKLLAVIGGLLAALLGFLVWNRILQRLVERRGRQLFKEQVAHISANLRTEERTRLAIELHDSISQNLTGVTLEIKAAQATAEEDLPTALAHLGIAERSLASCHTELRNCLWDLRHGTLESVDMNGAIRQVLRPQIGNVRLDVRFNVPRHRLTDNTAYSILKIIRELAVNAVHHGKATSVKVAGALESGRILFSVTDNGCGFNPDAVPGPEQGHFGLLGVTERVNSFEGEMRITSAAGKGTRIVLSLRSPQTKEDRTP